MTLGEEPVMFQESCLPQLFLIGPAKVKVRGMSLNPLLLMGIDSCASGTKQTGSIGGTKKGFIIAFHPMHCFHGVAQCNIIMC